MKLIVARHGETIENANGIIQGQQHGCLSEKGIKQAKMLASRLKNEKIEVIFCSDLNRAKDTAMEVKKLHPNAEIIFSKLLRERYFGEIEGKEKSKLGDIDIYSLDCCETQESLMKRVGEFIDSMPKSYGCALIVAHGGTNIALTAKILGITFEESLNMGKITNTGVNIFEPFPKLKLFNCSEHLN